LGDDILMSGGGILHFPVAQNVMRSGICRCAKRSSHKSYDFWSTRH